MVSEKSAGGEGKTREETKKREEKRKRRRREREGEKGEKMNGDRK